MTQFLLVSSLGTGKLGWPAGVLNLFGGVLVWKREAEKALEASGMAYTIVRPGELGRRSGRRGEGGGRGEGGRGEGGVGEGEGGGEGGEGG